MKNTTIWSNYPCDNYYEETEQYAEAENYDLYSLLYDTLDDLHIMNDRKADLIAIADLGLWYGRRTGYKELSNVRDCFYDDADYLTWYIDRYNNLRCRAIHHDGTNNYLYREWKDNLSYEQKENFKWKLYQGKATSRDLSRYTKAIGDTIEW